MSKISIDFRGAINSYADAKDLDLSPEKIDAINAMLNTFAVPDLEAGTVRYEMYGGAPTTLADILSTETAAAPKRVKPAAPPRPDGTNKTMSARERLASLRTAQLDAAVAEIMAGPNPWARATFHRTKQAIVTKHNPDAARELRQQAGAR